MKDFDKYKQTIARLPFTTIFALNDPEGHLGILNDLAIKHLEEHVLMKRIWVQSNLLREWEIWIEFL